MKRLLVSTLTILLASIGCSQELPDAALPLLNARFGEWDLLQFGIPKGADSSQCYISPNARNVLQCDLNGDTIPDYAVALEAVHGAVWFEYFVGLVGRGNTFELHLADSMACDGCNQMTIARAHLPIPYFDSADEDLSGYGNIAADKQSIVFPTDCIVVTPIPEMHTESSYVFFRDKFVGFPSAD